MNQQMNLVHQSPKSREGEWSETKKENMRPGLLVAATLIFAGVSLAETLPHKVKRATLVSTPTASSTPSPVSTPTPTPEIRNYPTPIADNAPDTSSSTSSLPGILIIGVVAIGVWFLISKFKKAAPAQAPTEEAVNVQQLVLNDLANGITPTRFALEGYVPKRGESVIWAFNKVKYYHESSHSAWEARSRGYSVHITKGVTYRVGASRGHRRSYNQMDFKGVGTLVFTNQAICFIGTTDSVRVPLNRIMAIQSYRDGFGFQTDYARNPHHAFGGLHRSNVEFANTVVHKIAGQ